MKYDDLVFFRHYLFLVFFQLLFRFVICSFVEFELASLHQSEVGHIEVLKEFLGLDEAEILRQKDII
jgi:hypothetical protein